MEIAERLCEERERMRPLAQSLPDPDRRFVIRVAAQPYLRLDTNDYSLDPRLAGLCYVRGPEGTIIEPAEQIG